MRGGIDQMTTEDGFQPDRPPIFLSRHAEETEQPDIGKGWYIAAISSRILKVSILAVAVTAIGIAVLSVGNPVVLVANVADWWVDRPALQPEADPAMSTTQTIADTQDSPTATTDAPPREEIAAALESVEPSRAETAGQRPAENSQPITADNQPVTEELFKQFQAWAAEEETRKQASSAQAAPARVGQDGPAPARPAKKPRRVHSVQNAHAEIRPQRHHRARVREQQLDVREQAPPAAAPQAPDPYAQNAQPPSFLQSLGFRN